MATFRKMLRRSAVPLVAFAFNAALFIINFTGVDEPVIQGNEIGWPYLLAAGAVVFVVSVGWTFYGYQTDLDEREKYERALEVVEEQLMKGARVLSEVGYDPASLSGYTSPKGMGSGYAVWFGEVALPQINEFAFDTSKALQGVQIKGRYQGTLDNVGNVHQSGKYAMLGQLEGWLKQLEKVADDLRTHL